MQRNHEAFMAQQESQFHSSMNNANAAMNARSTVLNVIWFFIVARRWKLPGDHSGPQVDSENQQNS